MFAFPFHTKLNPLFQKFPDFFQSCRYGLLYRLIAAPFPHRNLLIGGYDGNEWKLTLLDSSRNFSVTEETASGKPGDTITLNYTGASTGDNENISVILADDSGAQYYGRIAKPTTADGQVKITIPASLADGTPLMCSANNITAVKTTIPN